MPIPMLILAFLTGLGGPTMADAIGGTPTVTAHTADAIGGSPTGHASPADAIGGSPTSPHP